LNPRYRPAPTTPSLGDDFFDVVSPARFPRQTLRFRNQRVAESIGLGDLDEPAWLEHFARFAPLPGNLDRPLALRYHGHQFQQYNPRLGDGRGFLYAQLRDPRGRLLDLSTKGSGQTPWSRGGDGRLTLKGGVREILATEMLEALSVHTSKTLSLVETGEQLTRGDEPSPTRAAVLVRLVWSSLRLGTFQRLAHEDDRQGLTRLVDYAIQHYFPSLAEGPGGPAPERLFLVVARRAAELVAQWSAAGFVHGVLNSDNLNVTGESFDYGPWRFLPHYDPGFTAAYFDQSGLYAFGRQGAAVRWNLERYAEALSPIAGRRALEAALIDYEARILRHFTDRVLARLNLVAEHAVTDSLLVQRVLCFLGQTRLPWDRFFFDWEGGEAARARACEGPHRELYEGRAFDSVRELLFGRAPRDPARLDAPYLAGPGPVTMHIDEVERVWAAIAAHDDWSPLQQKIADVRRLGQHLRAPSVVLPDDDAGN